MCASMCSSLVKRGGKYTPSPVGLNLESREDRPSSSHKHSIPAEEAYLLSKEQSLSFTTLSYPTFTYLIKRYSYKGTPLQDHMLRELSAELNLDYDQVEKGVSEAGVMLRDRDMWANGCYNVERMQCIGFLYGVHEGRQQMMDEFWQVVNPEIEEEC